MTIISLPTFHSFHLIQFWRVGIGEYPFPTGVSIVLHFDTSNFIILFSTSFCCAFNASFQGFSGNFKYERKKHESIKICGTSISYWYCLRGGGFRGFNTSCPDPHSMPITNKHAGHLVLRGSYFSHSLLVYTRACQDQPGSVRMSYNLIYTTLYVSIKIIIVTV